MANFNFVNARHKEQIRRMKLLKEQGRCYLCQEGSKEENTLPRISWESEHFYLTPNDFPQAGSTAHTMIVPKKHRVHPTDLTAVERIAIFEICEMVMEKFEIPGFSVYVRMGDMSYTGATLDHLHFQLIAGVPRTENHKVPEDVIYIPLGYKQK